MKLALLDDIEIQNRFLAIEKIRAAGLIDNKLKVSFSWPLLKQCGQIMEVVPPPKKTMRMKSGQCYGNAHSKVQQGYSYIEGIIRHKESGVEISHAWNLTPTGTYVDFTIMETSQYEYFGVEVPLSIRFQIGFKTSPHWYCTLPYLQLAF